MRTECNLIQAADKLADAKDEAAAEAPAEN